MPHNGWRGGQLKLLSTKDLTKIHSSALDILENIGLRVQSTRIMKIYEDAGAKVDLKEKKVNIPRSMVNQALKKAPRKVMLHGRDPRRDILLEDSRVYFGLGGSPIPQILDYRTGEYRRPHKSDVAEATRLGDALDNYSFVMSIAGAYDVPPEVEYLHELEAIYANTGKPIIHPGPGAEYARKVLEIATAVAGGKDEFEKRPIIAVYSETASPLVMPSFNENIIEFAKVGAPIIYGPSPMAGATAPASLAGSVLIGTAECLASITLAQLVKPGAPVVFGPHPGVMHPRYAAFQYGAVELAKGWAIVAQLARYYGIPSFGQGGCSDSKVPDAQAGVEGTTMAMMNALGGINLIHNVGTIAMGTAGSMEMAVICDELIGMIGYILRPTRVDKETLAIDLIREVGPQGSFLGKKHTLNLIPVETYIPKLFDKRPLGSWVAAGAKSVREMARERIDHILKEHQPTPLNEQTKQSLAEVLKRAEFEFVKKA